MLGLIDNTFVLALMIFYKNSFINIFLFCFINLFIKILPLWSLRKTKYEINGIYSLIILFCIYLLWLKINNVELLKNSNEWFNCIKNDNGPGPFTYYVKQFLNI
jgi:signal transduction histidine kinase